MQYAISLLFAAVRYFLIARLMFFNIFCFVFCFVFFFLFCVFCVFVYYVLFLLLCCLFPIFVQVYRPLPPGGNPIAVNKYHIISYHMCVFTLVVVVNDSHDVVKHWKQHLYLN